MKKTILSITTVMAICVAMALPTLADELKVTVGVENGSAETKVVGADIYATIDGKLTEIMVRPDDQAFFMNLKTGALRIKSFWMSNAKTKKVAE